MRPANCLHKTALLVFFLLPATGCSSSTRESADNIDELQQLVLTETRRIGSVDDPDIGFSQVGGVQVDREGLIHVLERQDRQVRTYTPSGELVRRIGRQGGGPGEFEAPFAMGLIGDTIWVTDIQLGRLSLFTREGNFIGSFSPPPIQLDLDGVRVMLRLGGFAPDRTLRSTWGVAMSPDAPSDTVLIPVVRMDTAGAILDTLRYLPFASSPYPMIRIGERQVPGISPPSAMMLNSDAADGGAFVVERPVAPSAETGAFHVLRLGPDGDTVYARTFRYAPRRYNDEIIDRFYQRQSQFYEMIGMDPDALRAQALAAAKFPPFLPPIASVTPGADGTLWIRREENGTDTAQWTVIDPAGNPVGTVDLHRGATPYWITAGEVWIAEPDDFDVPWLVNYRVTRSGG